MFICEIAIDWMQVLLVIGIFGGIALLLTIAILLIAKFCKVDVEEKVENVLSNLAGANCGGCGCSGCEGFAKKLCDGTAILDDCHVTDPDSKKVIASIIGVDYSASAPTVMVVRCSGGNSAANEFRYCGNQDCNDAALLFSGSKMCKDGCLGGGSCLSSCGEKAIHITNECASVEPKSCISCGKCMDSCPKGLFERIPVSAKVYVACSSKCKGKTVSQMCDNGCIGCGLCAKFCPEGAIVMNGALPVINHALCNGCETCVTKCPRKVIKSRKNLL